MSGFVGADCGDNLMTDFLDFVVKLRSLRAAGKAEETST